MIVVVMVEPTTTVTYAGDRRHHVRQGRSVTGTLKLSREKLQTL